MPDHTSADSRHPDIKGIVFDKDGVLLDFSASWWRAAESIAEFCVRLSCDQLDKSQIFAVLGVQDTGHISSSGIFASGTMTDIYAALQQSFPVLQPFLSDPVTLTKMQDYVLQQSKTYVALGDVAASLETLKSAGYALMVLTNDNQSMTAVSLAAIGVSDYFSAIMTADQGYGGKPDPCGLQTMLDQQKLRPDQVVMVGDTSADVLVAENAGVRYFVGISEAFPDPTPPLQGCSYLLADISGLPSLLAKLD